MSGLQAARSSLFVALDVANVDRAPAAGRGARRQRRRLQGGARVAVRRRARVRAGPQGRRPHRVSRHEAARHRQYGREGSGQHCERSGSITSRCMRPTARRSMRRSRGVRTARLKLLGVTVLTSLTKSRSRASRASQAWRPPISSRIARGLLATAGFDGVVASGQEAGLMRAVGSGDFLIVTPGIRLPGGDAGRSGARHDTREGNRSRRRRISSSAARSRRLTTRAPRLRPSSPKSRKRSSR